MKKTKRILPSQRSILPLIIALSLAALALFLLKDSIFHNNKNIFTNRGPAADSGAVPPTAQEAAPASAAPTTTPAAEPTPAPAEATTTPPSSPCQQIADNLTLFLKQLEDKPYIKAYGVSGPLQAHLETVLTRLLDNPPVNANETADLLTILKNNAHIYRTIGAKDLSLLKAILTNEHEAIEPLLATLYDWSVRERECPNTAQLKLRLPLAKTYEYAAFFLNTLGGKSYLSRRDPTVRVLIRYYAVLIVQQAAKHSANKYDIDLGYHLQAISREVSDSGFLEHQERYLDTLKRMRAGH